jgi:hypothetical protein
MIEQIKIQRRQVMDNMDKILEKVKKEQEVGLWTAQVIPEKAKLWLTKPPTELIALEKEAE